MHTAVDVHHAIDPPVADPERIAQMGNDESLADLEPIVAFISVAEASESVYQTPAEDRARIAREPAHGGEDIVCRHVRRLFPQRFLKTLLLRGIHQRAERRADDEIAPYVPVNLDLHASAKAGIQTSIPDVAQELVRHIGRAAARSFVRILRRAQCSDGLLIELQSTLAMPAEFLDAVLADEVRGIAGQHCPSLREAANLLRGARSRPPIAARMPAWASCMTSQIPLRW